MTNNWLSQAAGVLNTLKFQQLNYQIYTMYDAGSLHNLAR